MWPFWSLHVSLTLLWLGVFLSLSVSYWPMVSLTLCLTHTCILALTDLLCVFDLKGSWPVSWKHMWEEFGEMMRGSDILTVLPLLEVQTSLDTYTPFPLPFFVMTCICLWKPDVPCCARRGEREKKKTEHEVVWYFINRLQEMRWGGVLMLLVGLRVQTVTVYLDARWNVPTILTRPWAKQGGFLADTAGSGRG